MGVIKTFQAFTRKEALGPFMLQMLLNITPNIRPEYNFVLLSQPGWSFSLFNLSSSTGQLAEFILMMLLISKIGTWFKYNIIIAASQIGFTLYVLISFSVTFSDHFDKDTYATIFGFCNCLWVVSTAFVYFSVVGRISKFLPEGFESTGVTLTVAFYNFSFSFGQYLGSLLLQYYNVKGGYYERIKVPQLIVYRLEIMIVAACPLFLPS